ncbi:MAG: energy transducer TonB [Bacteroidota bacterium]
MKNTLLIILLICAAMSSKSQTRDTTEVFAVVERQPEFPGGIEVFLKFIGNNIQYPATARANGTQGKVFVSFVVEKDGSIQKAKIVRPLSPDLDAEALRIVNASPKWKPGENNGFPVRALFTLPITFKIGLDETMPEFPGGLEALMAFIKKNLNVGNEQGVVKVYFVIDKEGSVADIKVLNSLSSKADAEAIRIVKKLPKWKPATQNGKAVQVSYTMPVIFSNE